MNSGKHILKDGCGGYGIPGTCIIEVSTWPYDCNAKDENPTDIVYICHEHGVWFHKPADV